MMSKNDDWVNAIMPTDMRGEADAKKHREWEKEQKRLEQIQQQEEKRKRMRNSAFATEKEREQRKLEKINEAQARGNEWLKKEFKEIDFSDEAQRIKRNLLIVSSITLFYKLSNASIKPESFFGIKIENIKENFIDIALSLLILYHFISFLSRCYEIFSKYDYKTRGKKLQKFIIALDDDEEKLFKNDDYQAVNQISLQIEGRYDEINRRIYWRWLLIDAGLPFALSVWALVLLVPAFFNG